MEKLFSVLPSLLVNPAPTPRVKHLQKSLINISKQFKTNLINTFHTAVSMPLDLTDILYYPVVHLY